MMFQPEKYARSIALHCPTCAGTLFESEPSDPMHKCVQCGRMISQDELSRENGEHVQTQIDEVKAEIAKDLRKHLQDALRGNKFIRVK